MFFNNVIITIKNNEVRSEIENCSKNQILFIKELIQKLVSKNPVSTIKI